jgi:hypothetical protein
MIVYKLTSTFYFETELEVEDIVLDDYTVSVAPPSDSINPRWIDNQWVDVSDEVRDNEAQEQRNQIDINLAAMEYLSSTDWYEIRAINGKPVPEDILQKRQEAREAIV